MNSDGSTELVYSADKVKLSVREWGKADGPEILLIHGLAQSHLSFVRQFESGLAQSHRIVAFDLRGHGMSDKPLEAVYYRDGKRWADDVEAVIEAKRLRAPVVAGWSLGGRVIRQYLMHYGDRRLSGINFVSCRPIEDPGVALRDFPPIPADGSRELGICIATAIAFLRACFNEQPSEREFEQMLAFNMMIPHEVREAIAGWSTDIPATIKALNSVRIPTLITHGRKDRLILPAAAEMTGKAVKSAKISLYDDCGHSPFFEDAPRFNRELAELAAAAWPRKG